MGKLLPILLALIGLGVGVGAGFMLRPQPAPAAEQGTEVPADSHADAAALESANSQAANTAPDENAEVEFVKLNNQFVVPVVSDDRIAALVVLSLSLEVPTGGREAVYQREPKLRDSFLQVLFDHANSGGFSGAFTGNQKMEILRNALLETARKELGETVKNVLITDIARQDM